MQMKVFDQYHAPFKPYRHEWHHCSNMREDYISYAALISMDVLILQLPEEKNGTRNSVPINLNQTKCKTTNRYKRLYTSHIFLYIISDTLYALQVFASIFFKLD